MRHATLVVWGWVLPLLSSAAANALESNGPESTALKSTALERDPDHSVVLPTPAQCRPSISYSAPAACPDTMAIQKKLGTGFRVHAGDRQSCPECAVDITVRERPARAPAVHTEYELQLSGLESMPATRPVCEEVIALALHTVAASDLAASCSPPAPKPSPLFPARLGTFFAPSMRLSNEEVHSTFGLLATWSAGALRASGSVLWVPPTQLPGRQEIASYRVLSIHGYGAGADVCLATLNWLHLCGLGMWRQMNISPVGHDWENVEPMNVVTGGVAVAVDWKMESGIGIELQPALLFSPSESITRDKETDHVLHDHSGFEAQLRLIIAWHLQVNSSSLASTDKATLSR